MENPEEEKKPRRKVKKAKGHGGHHGGAWKVAYADFVTAMMALFLVLWLVSQADTKLKQSIASYFTSPGVFDTMKGGILSQAKKVSQEPTSMTSKDDEQVLFSVAEKLKKEFSSRPEFTKFKDQVKIEVTAEGLKIELIDKADRVSFPSGSASLAGEAQAILEEIARGLCGLPNKINIGGHTDKHVFASDNNYTNWELSADRANAARRALQNICVKPDQINRIVGYADTEPLVPDDPYSPSNRRISIMVLRLPAESGSETGDDGIKKAEDAIDKAITDEGESEPSRKEEASPKKESKPINSNSNKDVGKPVVSETKANSVSKTAESGDAKVIKSKLANEGKVQIGEADEVPNKPKIKPEER